MVRLRTFFAITFCILLFPAWASATDDPLKPEVPDDYELHKLLVDTINEVERSYVKPVDRRKLVEAAIQGVLRELDDYSGYVAPESMSGFRTAVSHKFGGIGIKVGMERDQLTVISPLVGSPAYRAGIIAGDRIIEIDDKPTKGLRLDDAVKLLKGENGTSVVLTVSHPGRFETEDIKLTREVIRLETVLGDQRGEDDQWDFLFDDDLRIGYIRITGFGSNTANDLRKALTGLKKQNMAGLILDLRFNPGGLLSSAIQVADLFVSEGKIVSTEGRNVKQRVWNARKRGTFEGFPVAILVNGYSASASEIVSACLQDHGRAVVMGERTYGKGSVQRVIEMEGGQSALKLTTAGYHRPNGKNIHRYPGATPEDEWGVKPNEGFELKLSRSDMMALGQYRRDRDILKAPEGSVDDEESAATEEPALEEGATKDAGEEAEDSGRKLRADFVDRQLEMALDHLRGELTKQVVEDSEKAPPAEAEELAKAPKDAVESGADDQAEKPAATEPAAVTE
jgi:carboxyl-terminal processing protease